MKAPLAMLKAPALTLAPRGIEVNKNIFGDDRPSRCGYMEFFDWLAGTTDNELKLLAKDIPAEDRLVALGAIDMKIREAAGLAIWRNL